MKLIQNADLKDDDESMIYGILYKKVEPISIPSGTSEIPTLTTEQDANANKSELEDTMPSDINESAIEDIEKVRSASYLIDPNRTQEMIHQSNDGKLNYSWNVIEQGTTEPGEKVKQNPLETEEAKQVGPIKTEGEQVNPAEPREVIDQATKTDPEVV